MNAETAGEAIDRVAERLAAAGIPSARFEARLLVAHVLGLEPARLIGWPETRMDGAANARLRECANWRTQRVPMAHILGYREFWGLRLTISPEVLIPRPETETLIETVITALPDRHRSLRILDLGTGSGCILLALLHEYPDARGLGVDASPEALSMARSNARSLGLDARCDFRQGDWCSGLNGRFDVIVSNPPYIPDPDIDALEPEVSLFDPRSALSGGADGLACYRRLADDVPVHLAPDGLLCVEFGQGQEEDIERILGQRNFHILRIVPDLAGTNRCLLASHRKNL